MKRIAAVAALMVTLALTGCSHEPVEGTITSKKVIPGHTQLIYVMCGKTPCPIYNHIPTCYRLEIDTPQQTEESVCVDQSEWEDLKVGSQYKEGSE